MEIGNLIKKQQLSKLQKESARGHHTKITHQKSKGSRLQRQRQALKMSIPQLSMMTGIDQITLKRWETNGMTPDDKISQIRKYAKVMHLDLAKLVQSIVSQ